MRAALLSLPLLVVALGSSIGCSASESPSSSNTPAPGATAPSETVGEEPTEQVEEEAAELFGAKLVDNVAVIAFDTLVAQADGFKGKTVETHGIVRANCQKRGCWMEVRSENDAASPGMTVRFKNYGFFIPLDSRGAKVRLQGKISVVTLSADEVKELESEGGDVGTKNADGTATSITFMANGVEMRGRQKK